MGIRLVIFDLDGTLLNTISDLGTACNYALKNEGLPQHQIEDYNRMVGNGFRKLIEKAAPGRNAEEIQKLVELSRAFYDTHNTVTTKPYPGIPELLKEMEIRGLKLAVASNKYQSATERIIRHYFPETSFVSIQGQQEERPIKPDPSIIYDIIDISGISKEETILIGDSDVDITTAHNAEIPSIAVTWGFNNIKEIQDASPDYIVSNTSRIVEIIDSLE